MIKYRAGYKYQLAETYAHKLPADIAKDAYNFNGDFLSLRDGYLVISNGYAWDGPSGPTIDTKTFMRGSLVHDALYQLMRLGAIPRRHKDSADKELQGICTEDGMSSIRAWLVYRGVKRFGMQSTISNRDIRVAP